MAAANNPLDAVIQALPPAGVNGYLVAYSGGLDSSVLLHRLVAAPAIRPLRAVHVQHDLAAAAPAWAEHCRAVCRAWQVPLTVLPVQVSRTAGDGPEAAARRVRYDAIRQILAADEVLLTAHHAEDQAETFLLQALRGSGVRGLAAMPAIAVFGAGHHARPLLGVPRAHIRAYAQAQALGWVEDPANADLHYERSYLRTQVWPALAAQRPGAAQALARSAAWCAEAAALQGEWAALDRTACAGPDPACLALPALAALGPARRRNLLRYWLAQRRLPPPDHRHLAAVENDCLNARAGANPVVAWPGAQLRRYGQRLYALAPLPGVRSDWSAAWNLDLPSQAPLSLPDGSRLCATAAAGGLRPDSGYCVRLRRGGERLRLPGRRHHTALKKALQAAAVPPWVRERLPLVCADDRIAAVADLWVCPDFRAAPGAPGWALHWHEPPPGWPPIART